MFSQDRDARTPIQDWIDKLAKMDNSQTIIDYFQSYKVQNPSFDIKSLINSDTLRIRKRKTSLYFGEMNADSHRHGQGVLCYFDGRLYEGSWEQDQKSGKAVEIQPNGSKYVGFFGNGKRNGKGQYKWVNGEVYDGEWKNGLKYGSGLWKSPKGDSYIGEWKNGKADGFGVHTWINGDRYEGEFLQFLKHGLGTERFANGDVYVGNYEFGKPEGYGEYFWNNGNYYKGYFVNGLRHGRGLWQSVQQSGDTYEGEYRNDKKSGFGEYHWASGNIYKGSFENDLRHGYGEMFLIDNTIHKGYWMNGVQVNQSFQDSDGENRTQNTEPIQQFEDDGEYQAMQLPHNLPAVQVGAPVDHSPSAETDRYPQQQSPSISTPVRNFEPDHSASKKPEVLELPPVQVGAPHPEADSDVPASEDAGAVVETTPRTEREKLSPVKRPPSINSARNFRSTSSAKKPTELPPVEVGGRTLQVEDQSPTLESDRYAKKSPQISSVRNFHSVSARKTRPQQESKASQTIQYPFLLSQQQDQTIAGPKSQASLSISPQKRERSHTILPKLECKQCSSKQSLGITTPRRHGSVLPHNRYSDQGRTNRSSSKNQDLSTDFSSSGQRKSSKDQQRQSSSRIWRPSGVAQAFNPVGFDLNAKNYFQQKLKQ